MSPQIIALILAYGLKYGPTVAKAIKDMFTKAPPVPPTDAEWNALWAMMAKPYQSYIDEAVAELAGIPHQ